MGVSLKSCPTDIQFSAYLDGELSVEVSKEIEEHLRSCTSCCEVFSGIQSASDLFVRNIAVQEPPAWMKHKLMNRIRGEEKRQTISDFSWRKLFPVFAQKIWIPVSAAILLVVLPISLQKFQSYQNNDRLLSEIEMSKSNWASKASLSKNPFDINGDLFHYNAENPFSRYLNER